VQPVATHGVVGIWDVLRVRLVIQVKTDLPQLAELPRRQDDERHAGITRPAITSAKLHSPASTAEARALDRPTRGSASVPVAPGERTTSGMVGRPLGLVEGPILAV
jgi:hypothetical protein